jgi:hypothetical protein
VTVSGVPAGASLSGGVDNGDGSWTLAVGELDGLTLTPPENFAGEIDLRVEATSVESGEVSPVDFNAHELSDYGRTQDRDPFAEVSGDGGTLHLAQNTWKDIVFDYEVTPDTVLEFEFRAEGEPEIAGIGFDNDERQSAGRTFCVHGTQGWGVDAGERYDGSGEWQKFSIRVGDHFTGDMDRLTFIHDQDARGDSGDSFFRHVRVFEDGATPVETSASVSADVRVVVDAVADAPELAAADAAGVEDGSIPLSIDAVATDASETVSLNIAGLPEGASLSAGTPNPDGSYTVRAEELGGLSVRPPADFSGSFDLRVTATAIEANGSAAETAQTITVDVAPVADGVAIEAPDASGSEDLSVPLRIGVEPMDADGSERVSLVRIGGLPDGASLIAGVDNGDGSYTLTPDELEGLAITPPLNFSGEMELSVEARSSDGADAAVSEAGLTVSVSGEADAPRLVTAPASGTAGEPMPLDIAVSITDADGSERIEEVRIAGVPGGASLSAGNDTGGGVWTLGPGDLRGLELTTPGGFAGELTLEVTAVSVEGDTSASTTAPLAVSVDAVPSVGGAGASGAGEPFEAGDDAGDAPDAIDWTETLEEGFGSEPNDAVAAMERLDERLAELAEADRAVAPGGLGLVEEIADEPLATSTPDLVPPTGDPVFEIEDSEPVARPDAAGASGGHPGEAGTPDARRPGDTDNEPDAAADSGEGSIARGEAGIFASLWGLLRSLGVRSDDIERSEMKKRSGS